MGRIVQKIQLVEDENGTWRVKGLGSNNEIIFTTEQYDSRGWAEQVAEDFGLPVKVIRRVDS